MSHAEAIKAEIWAIKKRDYERGRKEEMRTSTRPPAPQTVGQKKEEKANPKPEKLQEIVPGQRRGRSGKIKLPDPEAEANGVDLTAPPPSAPTVSRPPTG